MNEKKREIDFLKRKISTMSLDTESNTNHIITSNDSNNINLFDKGSENEKIYNINKNNLDDLEALYFFDKINLNHKRSFSHNVPFIKLKKDEKNLRKIKKKRKKFICSVNQSKSCKDINTTKILILFKSQTFKL